eukprot:5738016-Pyramimonas_sp.AAC.1
MFQAMFDTQFAKIENSIDDKVAGLAATVGEQGQMMKEITDRLDKSENRLNALEQMTQVNARLSSLVNSQG